MILLTYASFENADGMKSKLGYLLILEDKDGNYNIVHYGSNRCKRITRSVMAAEIQALVLGFDLAFLIKDLVEELLGRTIEIESMIDSSTVFNVIAWDGQTAKRRLQIDVLALRKNTTVGNFLE